MKKLIIKSSVITLSLILVVGALFFLIFSLAKPSVIANVAFNLNDKKVCVKYSEKQFLKTDDIGDLALLTERSIWANDDDKVVKYSLQLLSRLESENYKNDYDYEIYIVSSLVESLYKTGNRQKSVEIAFSYYDGVTTPNPVRVLIFNSRSDNDTLNLILSKLDGLENKTEETNYLITEINKLL